LVGGGLEKRDEGETGKYKASEATHQDQNWRCPMHRGDSVNERTDKIQKTTDRVGQEKNATSATESGRVLVKKNGNTEHNEELQKN